jgi:hypothetical protein
MALAAGAVFVVTAEPVVAQNGQVKNLATNQLRDCAVADTPPEVFETRWIQESAEGWTKYQNAGNLFKFAAPTPAVKFVDAEQTRWGWDLATFNFSSLKDRELLYLYDLSDPSVAQKVVMELGRGAKSADQPDDLWAAIGVEYDIKCIASIAGAELYSHAVVPIDLDGSTIEFLLENHDMATFAKVVAAGMEAQPQWATKNFGAVVAWSAGAKELRAETDKANSLYAWKGPFAWQDLVPVQSYIAVNQNLEIEGITPEQILTSESAWPMH